MKNNPKVLFIQPGPEGPHIEKGKNIFACLSRYLKGDVLSTTWWDKKDERNQKITEISEACGHFRTSCIRSGLEMTV